MALQKIFCRERGKTKMKKWYLQTWFIAIMFACWFLYGVPLIVGLVLLFIQMKQSKKLNDSYGSYDELQRKISSLSSDYKIKSDELEDTYLKKEQTLKSSYTQEEKNISKKISELLKRKTR